jgi:hypothetical protein
MVLCEKRAVSRVMPPDSQSFQPRSDPDVMVVDDYINVPSSPIETATDMMEVGNNVGHPPVPNNQTNDQPSTSTVRNNLTKMLKFTIQYCDRIITIELPESATVCELLRNNESQVFTKYFFTADLKLRLFKELKVSPCRQLLSGWARMSQYENTPFSALQLPQESSLHLTLKPSEGGFTAEDDLEVQEKLTGKYTLNIKCEEATYNLKYPGTQSILKVKGDVYTLTSIHVRNQIWSGWPPNIDDQTMLALSGINYPEHDLTVKRSCPVNHNKEKKQNNSNIVQIDSDDDEFEDASESFNVDDEYFVDNIPSKRTEPLIPDHIEDEIVGSISFSEQFTNRYGPVHPAFYQSTLEEAIKEACSKPAAERKILAIYLHHDSSVLTNVFCTQLLGYESVMQMFETNFILWGWDLTFESNRSRLQTYVNNALGATAAMSLRNIPVDRLPALVLIMRIRSSTDIFSVIHGNVGVNELLSSLIEAVEVFTEHQRVEIVEEKERAERELVKWEQDEAYRESLEADRAKEEAKRQQAQAESEARQRIENEKAQELARKEAYRKKVEASLPSEPPLSQGDGIAKIRFRLPNGESIERRFQANTPLKVLFDFLTVKGYPRDEYKVISSWPRRDLTLLDMNNTLKELKLCPQETVILEER